MNVTCPSCSTIYRVDPAKVPEHGVRARCRVCAAIFQVPAPGAAAAETMRAPAPPPEFVREPAVRAPTPPPAPSPVADPWAERSSEQAVPLSPPIGAPRQTPAPGPDAPFATRAEPVAPPSPPAEPPAPRTTAPRVVAPSTGRPSVAIPPVVSPAFRPSTPDLGRPPAAVPPSAPKPPAPAAGKRLVNPFMSQDPQQKAKRLARALISDLVVYYPDRRQEGLRKGNLKEAFGEEIKKSWEEYREQVGKEIAESTPYFNDALNEILAGGQKLF